MKARARKLGFLACYFLLCNLFVSRANFRAGVMTSEEVFSPTEGRSFSVVPPPTDQEDRKTNTEPVRQFDDFEQISENDIRKSLIIEAKRRKYWGTKAINKMVFEEIEHSCCYHYMLESFTEMRSIAESMETGGGGAHHASTSRSTLQDQAPLCYERTPDPWDFEIEPDVEFSEQTKTLELPSTQKLTGCHVCHSDGVSHCFHCRGYGTDKCQYCRGTGMKAGVAHPAVYTHPLIGTFPHADPSRGGFPGTGQVIVRPPANFRDKPYAVGTPVHFMAKAGLPPPGIGQHDLCIFCQGRGISECTHCKGNGKKTCVTCGGHGTVRLSTKLKVIFSVESSDYYVPCEIPEILIRTAKGEISFVESMPYVLPLKKYPVKEINDISRKFCSSHVKKFMGMCRILQQRHCVEIIAIAKVRFKLGAKTGIFYVYGNQRLCYIPKSPSRCSVM